MNKRRAATMMIFPLLALMLMACETATSYETGSPLVISASTPFPLPGQEEAYAAAQATLTAGQAEVMDLSSQATSVSLSMEQDANAAAQATLENYQRQLMELSIRGTEVSQNMAWAAATQQFIAGQTQAVWDAAANAQNQAATATYSAYAFHVTQTAQVQERMDLQSTNVAQAESTLMAYVLTATDSAHIQNVTQTAQAQAMLDLQSTQVAQAQATQVANSLTATPFAALQAEIVRAQEESDRRAWWDEFIVTPLKVFLVVLIVVLLIAGGMVAYQRLLPVLELRLRTISGPNNSPTLLVDGMIVDSDPASHQLPYQETRLLNHPDLTVDETPQVEIVGPLEPSITNWIEEAEQKLRTWEGYQHER